ncbi:MAG: hypothetical protein HUJ55_08625 [Ileibacterium sp.]|nr:hypothetical protein [Ileibacterium sp.]
MMNYINGCDLPEHVQKTIREVIMDQSCASITTAQGQAVLISKEEYDRLQALATGTLNEGSRSWSDHEMEAIYRKEIDF